MLLIPTRNAFSQESFWASGMKSDSKDGYVRVIGENKEGIFVLQYRNRNIKKSFNIERYDHQMRFISSATIKLGSDKLEKISVSNNGIIIGTSKNAPSGGRILDIKQLDANFVQVKHFSEVLAEPNATAKDDFSVKISENNMYLNIWILTSSSQSKAKISMCVLDSNLHKMYNSGYELPYAFENFSVGDECLDNKGNLYLISKHNINIKRKDNLPSECRVICINASENRVKDILVNNDKTHISDISLSYDVVNKKINLGGFFSEKAFFGTYGVAYLSVSEATFDVLLSSFVPINRKTVSKVIGERSESRGEELSYFYVKKVVSRSDGGILVISERYFATLETETQYVQGFAQTSTRKIYNYDDILIVSVSNTGKVEWENIINKKQTTINDGGYFSSFSLCITTSGLHLFFNDRMNTSGDVVYYKVELNGSVSQQVLLRSEKHYSYIVPAESKQIGYNRIILSVNQNKNNTLLKVKFAL